MEIRRFFLNSPINSDRVIVDGNEFHHMTAVLRYKVGYKAILCDGSGYDFYVTIEKIEKNYAVCRVDQKVENKTEPHLDFSLYICAIKSEKMDFAVQKAVELGAKRIIPVISQNTNEKNLRKDRLERIVSEASKQCGRASLCLVSDPISFHTVLEEIQNLDCAIMAYEGEKDVLLRDLELQDKKSIAIIIGSEGGFTVEEAAEAKEKGVALFSLGKRILRAETAAIATLAYVMLQFE